MYFFLTHTDFGLTHKKVLLTTETQRKIENIEDIYFQIRVDWKAKIWLILKLNLGEKF